MATDLAPIYFNQKGKQVGRLTFEQPARDKARRKRAAKKALGVGATIAVVGAAGLLTAGAGGPVAAASIKGLGSSALKGLTVKKAALGITAAGVLVSSKKARQAVKKAPKTLFEKGKTIGSIVEDPKSIKDILGISGDKSLSENILSAGKKIGVAGLITGGVLGVGAIATKKIKGKIEQKQLEKEISSLKPNVPSPVLAPNPFTGLGVPITPSVTGPQATQSNLIPKPVTNIIQISVR